MPASSEFITLCQTQVSLLIDGFGASQSAIYLTEDPTAESETALIPLVMFPETEWSEPIPFVLPPSVRQSAVQLKAITLGSAPVSILKPFPDAAPSEPGFENQLTVFDNEPEPKRVALPLIYGDIMWGLMVVGREHRRWTHREQSQLEQIAHTLAISCVLDQRSQWLMRDHDHRRLLGTQQQTTLSTLLHQFRNPLTTLRTLSKLLLKRVQSEDANRDLVSSMVRESTHLEHLLQQFDDAIESEEAVLTAEAMDDSTQALPPSTWLTGASLVLQPCWLHELVSPLLQSIAGRLDERNLTLHAVIPNNLPPVKANPTAFQEVLGNLIDNAIKYTPTGGEIWVSVTHEERTREERSAAAEQWVQVSDTGPGIPAQDLTRIFERRYRGVQADTEISGTGLGLAIAKDLVAQMEGHLQAYSPALVRLNQSQAEPGSTFRIVLSDYHPAPL